MNSKLVICLLLLVFTAVPCSVFAQDYEYHPALSDSFNFAVGAFKSDNSFKISAEGVDIDSDEEDIDFGNSVGVDESTTTFNIQLRWNFGSRNQWALSGQYFQNDATGDATLDEDVEWDDVIFREGTFVGAGVKLAVSRVFLGYSFVKKPQHDFGVGAGLHILDTSVFIEGQILINDEDTGFYRGDKSNSQPLPNIGAWYNFSPARKWLLHGRVDWISANVGDYDGSLWNSNIGVDYQAFDHVGFDLSYQYFELDVKVDKTDWRGDLNMRYRGPILSVTANW